MYIRFAYKNRDYRKKQQIKSQIIFLIISKYQLFIYKLKQYKNGKNIGYYYGDGKIEYAYSESNPAEYYSLDEVDDGKPNNITFSNPTIPAIETEFQIERLTNEGDLNGDGTDEIGFIERAVSRFVFYKVYSLRKGVWKEIVSVYTHDAFFDPINGDAPDLVRIAPNKTGYVIVQTIEWDDETEWHKGVEKSVKIK